MLAVTRTCGFGAAACPQPDPNALFKKLTAIKILNTQVISDEDARGVSDELTATVRCNAEDAARKVIVPAVAIAGIAAVLAGIAAAIAIRRR